MDKTIDSPGPSQRIFFELVPTEMFLEYSFVVALPIIVFLLPPLCRQAWLDNYSISDQFFNRFHIPKCQKYHIYNTV